MTELFNNELYFAKVNENAIVPTKRDEDGCYDLYCCSDEDIVIQPHTTKLIPTGIATAFDKSYRLSIRERGSNTKACLIVQAGQVDSGYRNQIFVALHNGNDIPVEIAKTITDYEYTEDFIRVPMSKAIAQFAMEFVPVMKTEVIDYDFMCEAFQSERGTGCLGSSGK